MGECQSGNGTAVSWPRAWPEPAIPARFKTTAADFVVREKLAFEPTGEGEHLLLHIEKTGLGTPDLARLLARAHGVEPAAVGYAGMKDKRAVTSQWFSLAGVPAPEDSLGGVDGVRVLGQTRHARKLRRGEIARNEFEIVLRGLGTRDPLPALERLDREGAPNYFGAQRFGRDNLEKAAAWLPRRRRVRVSRFRQGLYLSALRSYLFNQVLAERVRRGSWQSSIDGDVLSDGLPTGPLWGRGRSPASGEAAACEREVLEAHRELLDGLEHAGLVQDRRRLVLRAAGLAWSREGETLSLSFSLPTGGYATSFLSEVFELEAPEAGGGV